MKKQVERLIQTSLHSNPKIVISGSVTDASGVVTIDWYTDFGVVFVSEPVLLGLYPIGVSTGKTAQPICYHQEWIQNSSNFYTGMKVYSEGAGTTIHYAVIGVAKR